MAHLVVLVHRCQALTRNDGLSSCLKSWFELNIPGQVAGKDLQVGGQHTAAGDECSIGGIH